MYSTYPHLENIVKYVGDAAAASVIVVAIWEILRGGASRRFWPLIGWLLAANVAFHLLVDFVYWRRPAWTIHFAIQCAALCGMLVLLLRGRKAAQSR